MGRENAGQLVRLSLSRAGNSKGDRCELATGVRRGVILIVDFEDLGVGVSMLSYCLCGMWRSSQLYHHGNPFCTPSLSPPALQT